MTDLEELKARAFNRLKAPKQDVRRDLVEVTDTFVVLPKEELEAILDSLCQSLSDRTGTFSAEDKKNMLAAFKRLEG
ncbi:hypothetical protein D3C72_1545610 [compost metagenome]